MPSNLLDNAVRGCRAAAEDLPRSITLHEGLKNSRLILRCENTCPEGTRPPDGDPDTLASEHGWGLGILRRIAEDGGGDAVFDCEGTTFTAVIQLQTSVYRCRAVCERHKECGGPLCVITKYSGLRIVRI